MVIKLHLRRIKLRRQIRGGILWLGVAKNGGTLTLIINDENLHGVINYEDKIFHITKVDDKHYAVYENPRRAMPDTDDEPKSVKISCTESDCINYDSNKISTNTQNVNGHSNIRMLAVYTTAARTRLGNDANSIARLELMANQVSQAFDDNDIDGSVSIDLVATNHIPYLETGSGHGQILDDMKSDPTVIAMRDYYGADVVAILVDDGQYCGLANVIGANTNTAFFTILSECTNYTFPHELGHLLGARHNPEEDSGGTFEHGYLDTTNSFRTIMSYNGDPACCPRIGTFSTPGQFNNGDVIGTSATHDNERQILNFAPTASSFKSKVTTAIDTPSLGLRPEACYGFNDLIWTDEFSDSSVSYKLYRSAYSNMSSNTLVYNGTALRHFVNLASANDSPYFAVEACDSLGCSGLSPSNKAKYFNTCY